MNRLTVVGLFIILSFMLTPSALAVLPETELVGADRLESMQPEEANTAYGSLSVTESFDLQALMKELREYILMQAKALSASALQNGAMIILIALLSVICCSVSDSEVLPLVGGISTALVCMKNVSSCADVGRQALHTLTDYSHVLLPCLATAAAAGGAWSSASTKYAASTMVMDMLITAEQNYAAPFLYAYAATAITAKLTEHPLMRSVTGLMRATMKWGIIVLTSGFTLYLSITGILSGTVDASAAKAAKTVVSSALPVVGGILADASSAILSGAQILRNSIGLIGMLVILAVCVSPYLTLGVHYLIYQIAGSLASSFGEKRIGGVISCIGDVYAFLLGMVGCASVMLFVSVISLMRAVTPG